MIVFDALKDTNKQMALSQVHSAIAALTLEVQLATVDAVEAFLGERLEVDDEMTQMFAEFRKTLAKTSEDKEKQGKVKRTRAPSSYNMYIKEKMAELAAQGKTGHLMKLAVEAWNADKAAGKVGGAAVEKEQLEKITSELADGGEVTMVTLHPAENPLEGGAGAKKGGKGGRGRQ